MCCRRWVPPGDPVVPSPLTAATLRDECLQRNPLQWEWSPSNLAPWFLLSAFSMLVVPRVWVGLPPGCSGSMGGGATSFAVQASSAHISFSSFQMFKGPDKDIEFIYTAPSSAVCGVSLDIGGKKEYLIAGVFVNRHGARS